MIEWKEIDYLPHPIPCEWRPFLYLDKGKGIRLFRLRLATRTPGENLIVRIKQGNFKLIKHAVDYGELGKMIAVEDLKAAAIQLGLRPLSDTRKVKAPVEESGEWARAPFYGQSPLDGPASAGWVAYYQSLQTQFAQWANASYWPPVSGVTASGDVINVTFSYPEPTDQIVVTAVPENVEIPPDQEPQP